MQEHDANTSPTAAAWVATYNKFNPICTEMAVTEIDVTTGSATPSASVLATQANQYGMLFKCFVERSYKSGRGKIINVTKDGLNDANTFKTGQSSSLWNATNQCKPSYYAVANVGLNYNSLDSLTSYADSLKQNAYTAGSWATFSAALVSAKNVKAQNYSYSLSADTSLGVAKNNLKIAIDGLVTTGVADIVNGNAPTAYALSQNYPNPFNPTTIISYQLPISGNVSITVYDMTGREIATLFAGVRTAGSYTATFSSTGLASGVYMYQMKAGNFVETKRLVVLK
jgi:hypothetical protein